MSYKSKICNADGSIVIYRDNKVPNFRGFIWRDGPTKEAWRDVYQEARPNGGYLVDHVNHDTSGTGLESITDIRTFDCWGYEDSREPERGTDEITGLAWATELYEESRNLDGVGIVTADIDNFNTLHARYGQEKCEDAVAHVADVMKRVLPESAEIYRVPPSFGIRGGLRYHMCRMADEFVVLVPDSTRLEVGTYAHQLNEALARRPASFVFPGIVIDEEISLSVGYNFSAGDGDSKDEIQKAWDAAIIAKSTGKRRAVEWASDARAKESFLLPLDSIRKLRLRAEQLNRSVDSVLAEILDQYL